jgi:hypothetical protein
VRRPLSQQNVGTKPQATSREKVARGQSVPGGLGSTAPPGGYPRPLPE